MQHKSVDIEGTPCKCYLKCKYNHPTRRSGTKEDSSIKDEGKGVVVARGIHSSRRGAKNGLKSAIAVTKTQITLRYMSRLITLSALNSLCGAQQKRVSQIGASVLPYLLVN
jgi:hypothetical protein